jgi:thiol-disulfide isomerase/thioredoxin
MNMRYFAGMLIAGLAAMFFVLQAPGSSAEAEASTENAAAAVIPAADKPLTAVMFYSNWCGACQILDPKIDSVKPDFASRPVNFVKFDFSYALLRGEALRKLADENNLTHIYAQNKSKTGFMLLIDPDTEQVLDVVTVRDNAPDIAAKLNASLHRGIPVAS